MPNPVVHWEFWSGEPAACADFYAKAFDWKIHHDANLDYRMVESAGEGGIGGGIMKPQDGPWPGNMALYINVDDLDAAKQRIKDAGGTIVVEHQDVPGIGSFCLFADPDGRVLGCWKQQAPPG